MKYMLLVYGNEHAWDDTYREECYRESLALVEELQAAGQYVAAGPLQPTATAASVRVRDCKPTVTDGPFAETREQLGGYYLVDVASREEAVAIAARIPVARMGTIEVRPIIELAGLPETPCMQKAHT